MSADLAAWLLEQIAEDERVARAAAPGGWEYCEDDADGEVISSADPHRSVAFARGGNPRRGVDGMDSQNGTGRHIAIWQPRRVLAECDAKRRIVDLHTPEDQYLDCPTCTDGDYRTRRYDDDKQLWWCDTLKLLALPFRDREGYREEWTI